MPIRIYCDGCQRHYNAPDRCAGKKIQCKTCGGLIDVPLLEGEPIDEESIEADVVEEPAPPPPPTKPKAQPKPAPKPAAQSPAKPPAKPAAKPVAKPSAKPAHASQPPVPVSAPAGIALARPHRKRKKAGLPTVVILVGLLVLAGAAGLVTYLLLPGQKSNHGLERSGSDPARTPAAAPSAPAVKGAGSAQPAGGAHPASLPAGGPAVAGWTPLVDASDLLKVSTTDLPGLPPVACGMVPATAPDSPFVLASTRLNLGDPDLEGERRLAVYDLREDKPPVRSLTLRNLPKLDGRLSPDGLHYAYIGQKDNQPALILQSLDTDTDVKSQPVGDATWFDFAGAGRLVAYRPAKNAVSVWEYMGGQPAEFAAAPAGWEGAAVAAVSPTGKYLALPSRTPKTAQGPAELKITLYDLSTRKQAAALSLPLTEESAAVEGLAFSPEGKLLGVLLRGPAGATPSARVACWELGTGRLAWQTGFASTIRPAQPGRTPLLFLPRGYGLLINGREVLPIGQPEVARVLPAKGELVAPVCSRVFASGLAMGVWLDPAKPLENVTNQFEDTADLAP